LLLTQQKLEQTKARHRLTAASVASLMRTHAFMRANSVLKPRIQCIGRAKIGNVRGLKVVLRARGRLRKL